MIRVNGRSMAWTEGMTVASMLKEKNYLFSKIIVKINGVYVPKEHYENMPIHDGDEIQAIHLLAGG